MWLEEGIEDPSGDGPMMPPPSRQPHARRVRGQQRARRGSTHGQEGAVARSRPSSSLHGIRSPCEPVSLRRREEQLAVSVEARSRACVPPLPSWFITASRAAWHLGARASSSAAAVWQRGPPSRRLAQTPSTSADARKRSCWPHASPRSTATSRPSSTRRAGARRSAAGSTRAPTEPREPPFVGRTGMQSFPGRIGCAYDN
jgi:hypothetical protein